MKEETSVLSSAINTYSSPSDLKITDIRFCDVHNLPMHCILIKVYTNQGIIGFGEVRDGGSRLYAGLLKSLLVGQNPCHVDKLFRLIKPFGSHARLGGGVSGLEVALWDIAGKAYGQPVHRLMGGKFRDAIRMYCDTDIDIRGRDDGYVMGEALKQRMEQGYTFLKMDVGIDILRGVPGALSAPTGFVEEFSRLHRKIDEAIKSNDAEATRYWKAKLFDYNNIPHSLTGIHVTEKGFDVLEEYVHQVREVVGFEIPLAIDHFGHIGLENCIKLCKRLEKFNLAWAEDLIPWQETEKYKILRNSTTTPLATGEDIYLKENFEPLLRSNALAVIHPDVLSTGGILETKKIGDLAASHGVSMAIHMAESPIGCLAAVHAAAVSENFIACEFHSVDVPEWDDLYESKLPKPLVQNGFIQVPDEPGLGIESLNDDVLTEFLHPDYPEMWAPTKMFDKDLGNIRLWS